MTTRTRLRHALLTSAARLLQHSYGTSTACDAPRVLLLRPDHLGDLLLATPTIAALRETLPAAELVLAVGPWNRELARRVPGLSAIIEIDFPGFTRRRTRGVLRPYRYLRAIARQLAAQRFDAAIVMRDDHWWGGLLAAVAGIPLRIGYATPDLSDFLTLALAPPGEEHVAKSGLRLGGALATRYGRREWPTGDPVTAPLRFVMEGADPQAATRILAPALRDQHLVAIHAGSGAPVKLWEDDRWARVAEGLTAAGYTLALTGTASEAAVAASIEALARVPVLNLAGKTSVTELAALFSRCALVLGPDSGALHLAVAVGTPTVHLFGPASAVKFGPWGPSERHLVVDAGLRCNRCGDLAPARPRGASCMLAITTGQVLDAAFKLLRNHAHLQS